MFLPPLTERAISRFDVVSYLQERGYRPRESGRELVLDCPRCHRSGKFYVNTGSKLFLCFRCSPTFRGGLVRLVMVIDRIPFAEAVQFIQGRHDRIWDDAPSPVRFSTEGLPRGFVPLVHPGALSESLFWEYLGRRGVPYHVAMRYGMGRTYDGPLFGRLIIPVTEDAAVVHWVARDATGQAPVKVLTPAGNKQSQHLFNLDQLGSMSRVVVVEGVFDALRNPAECVASFGKRLSDAQIALLLKAGVEQLVIAYDGDAYQAALTTGLRLLGVFPEVRVARLPAESDPADLTYAEFRECVDAATVPTRFRYNREVLRRTG